MQPFGCEDGDCGYNGARGAERASCLEKTAQFRRRWLGHARTPITLCSAGAGARVARARSAQLGTFLSQSEFSGRSSPFAPMRGARCAAVPVSVHTAGGVELCTCVCRSNRAYFRSASGCNARRARKRPQRTAKACRSTVVRGGHALRYGLRHSWGCQFACVWCSGGATGVGQCKETVGFGANIGYLNAARKYEFETRKLVQRCASVTLESDEEEPRLRHV